LEFKKVFRNVSLAVGWVLLLSGCVAKGPQFQKFDTPKKGDGIVYIYRLPMLLGDGNNFDVYLDGYKYLGKLGVGTYLKKELPKGKYAIN